MKNSELKFLWILFLLIQVWSVVWRYAWWAAWCACWLAASARACKKKTICRPPPGARPGCGGRI